MHTLRKHPQDDGPPSPWDVGFIGADGEFTALVRRLSFKDALFLVNTLNGGDASRIVYLDLACRGHS